MPIPLLDTIEKAKARILELASSNTLITLKNQNYTPAYGNEIVDLAYMDANGNTPFASKNEIHYRNLYRLSSREAHEFAKITVEAFNSLLSINAINMEDTQNPIIKRLKLSNPTQP